MHQVVFYECVRDSSLGECTVLCVFAGTASLHIADYVFDLLQVNLFVYSFLKGGGSDCLFLKKVNQLNQGYLHSLAHLFCKMCVIFFSCVLLHTPTHTHTIGKNALSALSFPNLPDTAWHMLCA